MAPDSAPVARVPTLIEAYPYPWDGIIPRLIVREGGEVDDPDDRGGHTKHGITERVWRAHLVDRGEPWRPVSSITVADAAEVYWVRYVQDVHLRLEALPCGPVLLEVMLDTALLFGPARAARWLQRAIAWCRPGMPIVVDGVIGAKTRVLLAGCDERRLIGCMVAERCLRHAKVCQEDASQVRFIGGWITRATGWLLKAG